MTGGFQAKHIDIHTEAPTERRTHREADREKDTRGVDANRHKNSQPDEDRQACTRCGASKCETENTDRDEEIERRRDRGTQKQRETKKQR